MTDNKPAIKLHKTSIQLKQITKKYYFPNVTQKHKTQVYTFRKKVPKDDKFTQRKSLRMLLDQIFIGRVVAHFVSEKVLRDMKNHKFV